MHNIKDIRDNIDDFIKLILKRNVKIDKNNIIDLDKNNRKLIQEKEKLEKEKKDISKSKDKTLFEKSKKISSIGLRVRKGITFHGVSINMNPNLENFKGINP